MKIGIIGKGNAGSALKQGLEKAGHEVRACGSDRGAVRQTAAFGDVLVLAVPYPARADALRDMGDLSGKVLVDVTNAAGPDGYMGSMDESGAEEVQALVPGAQVVKAFNTVFAKHMVDGSIQGEPLTVLAAGDHGPSKQRVLELARDIGFDAVDAGPLENARYVEPMAFVNMQLGYAMGLGTDIGFRLVHPAAKRQETATAHGAMH